ncbi:MAG: gamma-glutamylcyclotransferase family protein [Phycisphaeraceae bacterium]
MLYFAYGSNLDPHQMDDRCPGHHVHARGFVRGYRLTFPRDCVSWAGGVASIEPVEGCEVWGVLYDLTADHLETLDLYEGVAEGDYWRETIDVVLDGGRTVPAIVYIAAADEGGPTPPSRQYLEAIVRGAQSHGLPSDYIAGLQKTPVNTPKPA